MKWAHKRERRRVTRPLTLVFFFAVLPWDAAGRWGGNYSRDGLHVELQPACLRGYYGRVFYLRRWVDACFVHFFPRIFDASVYMQTCTYTECLTRSFWTIRYAEKYFKQNLCTVAARGTSYSGHKSCCLGGHSSKLQGASFFFFFKLNCIFSSSQSCFGIQRLR